MVEKFAHYSKYSAVQKRSERERAGDPRHSPELRLLVLWFLGSSMARECEDSRLVTVHIHIGGDLRCVV